MATTNSFLARVLRGNAVFSAVSGIVLVLGALRLDDRWGVPDWLLALVGVGLVIYAAALVVGAGRDDLLVSTGWSAVVGDIGWCGAAVGVIAATDWLTTEGEIALGLVSIPVAVFAVEQWIGLRRLTAAEVTAAVS